KLANQPQHESLRVKGRVSKKLGRLGKMNLAELRARVSQAFAALAERRGWSALTELPSDQSLSKLFDPSVSTRADFEAKDFLQQFRSRNKQEFFAAFAN